MKYIILVAVFLIGLSPSMASARTQSVHHDFNEPYDCSITGAPQPIKWIKKGDKAGNKQIKLKWFDSNDAQNKEIADLKVRIADLEPKADIGNRFSEVVKMV